MTIKRNLYAVNIDSRAMAKKRSTYHHGDLRAALIQAADEIIAEQGIESFSLRAAAQRAGVSPAAPAHHFGSAKGLLTEVSLLAFERANRYIEAADHDKDVVADVRGVSLAFITFVLHHPGHFRLMFRNDLVNRDDPRFAAASRNPGMRLGRAVLAYRAHQMWIRTALRMPPICCAAYPPCMDSLIWLWKRRLRTFSATQTRRTF